MSERTYLGKYGSSATCELMASSINLSAAVIPPHQGAHTIPLVKYPRNQRTERADGARRPPRSLSGADWGLIKWETSNVASAPTFRSCRCLIQSDP